MRKLGTLNPDYDFVNHSAAFWYIVGYLHDLELPDSFYKRFTSRKLTKHEFRKLGTEVREKIKQLEDGPHADTRPNR